jgi:hypothetical protein
MLTEGATDNVCELDGGRVLTRWIAGDTLEATYSGALSAALVEEGRRRYWEVAGHRSVRFALVDTAAVTWIEAHAAHAGRTWLTDFKAQDGEMVVIVVRLRALRMVTAAALFATGVSTRTMSSREEAVARINLTRARRPVRPGLSRASKGSHD